MRILDGFHDDTQDRMVSIKMPGAYEKTASDSEFGETTDGNANFLSPASREALAEDLTCLTRALGEQGHDLLATVEEMAKRAEQVRAISKMLGCPVASTAERAIELSVIIQEFTAAPRLKPSATADEAVKILKKHGHPMHYLQMLNEVEAVTGAQVVGAQPTNTFLSRIRRDRRISRTDDRRGTYGLTEWAPDRRTAFAGLAEEAACRFCQPPQGDTF